MAFDSGTPRPKERAVLMRVPARVFGVPRVRLDRARQQETVDGATHVVRVVPTDRGLHAGDRGDRNVLTSIAFARRRAGYGRGGQGAEAMRPVAAPAGQAAAGEPAAGDIGAGACRSRAMCGRGAACRGGRSRG
jgi:hypothetical protein